MRYENSQEYYAAGLDKLPSSSSWSKLETDVLLDLCERYDLRFGVVTDRFVKHLKEAYDNLQVRRLDL